MEKKSCFEASQLNLLSLALLGDGVWSLYVRERLILTHDYSSGILSKFTRDYVNAVAQSQMLESILDMLESDESDIVRRARNTNSISKAKNASVIEYKRATALEALLGYLYITGQEQRLDEIMVKCFEQVEVSQ